jgi:hypothetical protein
LPNNFWFELLATTVSSLFVLLSLATVVALGKTPLAVDTTLDNRPVVCAVAAADKRTKRHISFKVLYILIVSQVKSALLFARHSAFRKLN